MIEAKEQALEDLAAQTIAREVFYDPQGRGDFLDFCYINVPPQRFGDSLDIARQSGKVKFEKWPHVCEMAQAFINSSLVCVLKARQLGFSWVAAAYAVWTALFQRGALVMMISRGEKEAAGLLAKAKIIYKNLPDSWKVPIGDNSKSEFSLPEMDSRIVALPSTQDAGRSETASVVIQDEADYHDYLEDNYSAVEPTVNMGGQIIMGSTSNKRKMVSMFKGFVKESPSNGWRKLFFGWNARPGRDADWYERTKRHVPQYELDRTGLTPEQFMEQEYPFSEAEALAPPRTMGYFDHDILTALEKETRKPIRQYPIYSQATGGVIGHINIYWHVDLRGKYVAGSDTSHGKRQDYSVTCVYNYASRRVVADIFSNEIEPDEFAQASIQLMRLYNNPLWCIEDNDRGIEVVKAARKAGYWNLYHKETSGVRGGSRGQVSQPGWHTTDAPDSRPILWSQLSSAIRRGDIIIPNEEGLKQFFSIIQNPDKNMRPEAMQGAHDDYPMAVGLAWQMIERKPVYTHSQSLNPINQHQREAVAMPRTW